MSLFMLTREVAGYLGHHLRRTYIAGASIGEESLTDLFVTDLRLRSRNPRFRTRSGTHINTRIIQCDHNLEKQSGADFLWYVGSNKHGKWIVFFVQAKKSKFPKGKCKLKHDYSTPIPIGRGKEIVRQVDNLIYKANIFQATPLYCFYNYFNTSSFPLSSSTAYLRKKRFPTALIKPSEFTFTYVKAEHVGKLLKKKRGKDASQNKATFDFEELKSFPFYTLFTKLHPMDSSTTIAQRLYRNTMFLSSLDSSYNVEGENSFDINNLTEEHKYVLDELPDYIKDLLNDRPIQNKKVKKLLPSYVVVTSTDEEVTDEEINIDWIERLRY